MSSSKTKIESCALQLHAWKPFVDSTPFSPKKPCRSDRSTAPNPNPNPSPNFSDLDLSRLSLADDLSGSCCYRRWFHHRKKRRRRGSQSVSGRSSDRRASAAYATCSDFPLAAGGTDSSGELFVNGEGSWGFLSDASETRVLIHEKEAKDESCGVDDAVMMAPPPPPQGNESSGYGSEPGYRGDGELGEEDGEFDEEEEDHHKLMLWGERFRVGDTDQMDTVVENEFSEQKAHHRCRRKKHDWRLIAPLR